MTTAALAAPLVATLYVLDQDLWFRTFMLATRVRTS
jgi:hypothetical protein